MGFAFIVWQTQLQIKAENLEQTLSKAKKAEINISSVPSFEVGRVNLTIMRTGLREGFTRDAKAPRSAKTNKQHKMESFFGGGRGGIQEKSLEVLEEHF